MDYDDIVSAVHATMDHEPTAEDLLEQRIARLYQECEDLMVLAAGRDTIGQFKGEWRQIDQAATRLQWVATAVLASVPSKLKVVSNG